MNALIDMQSRPSHCTPPGEAEPVAILLLSGESRAAFRLPAGAVAGFRLRHADAGHDGPVPPGIFSGGRAIIVEVEAENEASWLRLEHIVSLSHGVPVAAAIASPTHADLRRCLHLGVCDALSLPLSVEDLAAALERMGRGVGIFAPRPHRRGRVVAFLKSVGGVGATALLTQAGCLLARQEAACGRQACLLDLDIQFGTAALYLGLAPPLSFQDLLAAGSRADEALLRQVTASHASGLQVIAAPPEIMPLEMVKQDQLQNLIGIMTREFSTVLVDLPGAWTQWSLAIAARADVLCLVTELSVPGLHQARRQIGTLANAGVDMASLHVVANRVERRFWKPISLTAAEQALGHAIACTVGNDFRTLSAAIDQGVPLKSIRPGSRIERDLAALVEQLLPVEA